MRDYTAAACASAIHSNVLVRAGRPTLPVEPVCAASTRASLSMLGLVEAIAWRVEALHLQLRPRGAISFRPIQPFEDAPKRCSLCGGALCPGGCAGYAQSARSPRTLSWVSSKLTSGFVWASRNPKPSEAPSPAPRSRAKGAGNTGRS